VSASNATGNDQSQGQMKQTRKVATQAVLYVAVFVIVWLPLLVLNTLNLVRKTWFNPEEVNGFIVLFFVMFFQPLQGFFNLIVYLRFGVVKVVSRKASSFSRYISNRISNSIRMDSSANLNSSAHLNDSISAHSDSSTHLDVSSMVKIAGSTHSISDSILAAATSSMDDDHRRTISEVKVDVVVNSKGAGNDNLVDEGKSNDDNVVDDDNDNQDDDRSINFTEDHETDNNQNDVLVGKSRTVRFSKYVQEKDPSSFIDLADKNSNNDDDEKCALSSAAFSRVGDLTVNLDGGGDVEFIYGDYKIEPTDRNNTKRTIFQSFLDRWTKQHR
jgi:hypothetical protein